jgi:hypothetical protein
MGSISNIFQKFKDLESLLESSSYILRIFLEVSRSSKWVLRIFASLSISKFFRNTQAHHTMSTNTTLSDNYFGYDPNVPLAYVSAGYFASCAVIVAMINFRSKVWFMTPVVVASLMETIGFLLRPHCKDSMGPYIFSTLCILLAPTVFAIADYSLLGRT